MFTAAHGLLGVYCNALGVLEVYCTAHGVLGVYCDAHAWGRLRWEVSKIENF
jgi:hypothetical protein